ncbi:MAG: class I SAM-dependent methyltransferase [Candidatus Promineifilaceae bacterium]|nr:class I SAM-dependent methyltransferase [Candidatus Promineifilaceae bacterium]
MKGYGTRTFGELNAERYDALYEEQMAQETADSVQALAELAAGGRVLELAIGTGRVALPLAARGLSVYGIEAAEEMVAQMREKPGGSEIPVVIGDMAEARVDQTFDLVYIVFNTIFNLTTQEAQVRCFQNAARHLKPNGRFVVETVVPDLSGFEDGQRMKGSWARIDAVRFEVAIHDAVAQTVAFQRILIDGEGTRITPHFMRYAWPSELDLMARLADLERRERWAWWDKSPFTAASKSHVSVYVNTG